MTSVAFIGFGELGQAFASGLAAQGVGSAAWDIDFRKRDSACRAAAERLGVRAASSLADALGGAEIVISAVTASQSSTVAGEAAPLLDIRQLYVDLNSVSPDRKRESAALMPGGRYVDLAVMAPVHPKGLKTSCLAAGPDAEAAIAALSALGMDVAHAGPNIGDAAVIKMIRSVMIKGLEALTYECFSAAHAAGVLPQILDSLSKSFSGMEWRKAGAYNVSRMLDHGVRRAAELREVAATLEALGTPPHVTLGAAEHQHRIGGLGPWDGENSLETILDSAAKR